jgi:preprotein translocase subunit SecY
MIEESGGFIQVLDQVLKLRLLDKGDVFDNFPGSLFLALIAVFPAIVVSLMDVQQSWAMFFGVPH